MAYSWLDYLSPDLLYKIGSTDPAAHFALASTCREYYENVLFTDLLPTFAKQKVGREGKYKNPDIRYKTIKGTNIRHGSYKEYEKWGPPDERRYYWIEGKYYYGVKEGWWTDSCDFYPYYAMYYFHGQGELEYRDNQIWLPDGLSISKKQELPDSEYILSNGETFAVYYDRELVVSGGLIDGKVNYLNLHGTGAVGLQISY